MSLLELKVPDIGGSKDVNVTEVYVKTGDKIKKDDNLIMLETDKATMEVPATENRIVTEVIVKAGSKVSEGDTIVKIESSPDINSQITSDSTPVTKSLKDSSAAYEIKQNQAELDCEVLVIGAGPAGYTAAFRAADLGKKVILIEKYKTLGGVCLNVGCIPSKALLHIARVLNEATEMSHHGLEFTKPKLDLTKIRAYKNGIINKLTTGLNALANQRKVQVIQGTASFTSAHSVLITTSTAQSSLSFESAIIAVGSSPFNIPEFPEDPRVIDSTGALALNDIPESMLVVGGGIIGLEMAEVYSTLGSKISVVELGSGLIPGADRDLVKVLEKRISKRYSGIYTDTKCSKIEAKEDALYVTFNGPKAPAMPQKFDKILIAAGRVPNGKTIAAEKAGIFVNDKGYIPVDKQCRTNIAHIYAIGDVAGQPMLAHKGTYEGRIAAENCAGRKSYFDARVIPGIAYTDPEIAWMGVTELEAQQQGLEIEVGKFPWAASGRALGNGRDDGFTKIITDKKNHKIIGSGIVGVNAGELLAETVLALETNCDIHDVALSIHAHPTLSESIALACEIIDGSITDLYMPKK